MNGFKSANIDLKAKANKIKLVAFDVDGVMTDGSLTFDENGVEYKTFHSHDGQGIVMLNRAGFTTAIITARNNGTVRCRREMLGITKLFEGAKNKLAALDELCKEYNVSYEEIAYIGDDLPDICVMERVGLSCCPADAVEEVQEVVTVICAKNGGRGAVREMCDFLLYTQNRHPYMSNKVQAGV